jgi:hypothetical protein
MGQRRRDGVGQLSVVKRSFADTRRTRPDFGPDSVENRRRKTTTNTLPLLVGYFDAMLRVEACSRWE